MIFMSLFSSLTFASESIGGSQLIKYGFIEGKPGTSMTEKLDALSPLTREQLAAILVELYGTKTEASEMLFNRKFLDDNSISDWSRPHIQYAVASRWMSGYPDGSFKPRGIVTGKQLAAVLLNLLNYSYDYDSVLLSAKDLGLQIDEAKLSRGQAFEAIWMAVSTVKINEEDIVLGEKLGKLNQTSNIKLEALSFFAPSSRYFELEFNRSLTEQEKQGVDLSLSYFSSPLVITTVWMDEDSVLKISRRDNMKLGTGNYLLDVKGFSTNQNRLLTVVSPERPTYLKLNTIRMLPENNQSISFDVLNQYGELMTNIGIKPEFENLTKSDRIVSGTLTNLDFSRADEGDIIKLSAFVVTHPDVRSSVFITVTKNYIREIRFSKVDESVFDNAKEIMVNQRLGLDAEYSDRTPARLTPTMNLENKMLHDNFFVEYKGITSVGITEIGHLVFDLDTREKPYIKFTNQSNGLIFEYDFSDFLVR